MKLIIGLGNPGQPYQKTRHNLGFMVLDQLAKKYATKTAKWKKSTNTDASYLRIEINGQEIELFKPLTFMNNSGRAVAYAVKKHNFEPSDMLVIHDDIDLPLGELRVQKNRGAAGHKGVQSIIEALGTKDFSRIRIGINNQKPVQLPTEKYVLQNFTPQEKIIIDQAIDEAIKLIEEKI